jgi:hypothetical protein
MEIFDLTFFSNNTYFLISQQKEVEEHEVDGTEQEKSQNNLVSSFAEKAMSVAAPVVPTKGDGEVDHDRSV